MTVGFTPAIPSVLRPLGASVLQTSQTPPSVKWVFIGGVGVLAAALTIGLVAHRLAR